MSRRKRVQPSSDLRSPEEEVLQIIKQALKDGVTEVDLSNKGLTRLPPEIGKLSQLTSLYLSGNQLSQLPTEIGQLRQLKRLSLEWNQLSDLPAKIGQLGQLRTLYLSRNRLRQLPAEIGQLRQLTTLDLSWNKLSQLPAEIGQLCQLTTLNLSKNKLSQLPPEIGQLSQLTTLYLSRNKLSQLPAEIGQLRQLTSLYLGGNKLSQLPAEIGKLRQLTKLDLYWNQLSQLPAEIGQLRQLIYLYLSENKLRQLPAEIGQLRQLRTLKLRDNQLTQLPTKIGQLRQLIYLDLRNNPLPIPPEILSRINQPTAIIEYYLRENKKPLNEAKLVLVGQGRVGKSSLVKRLIENQFDENEAMTKGIAIKGWKVLVDGVEIKVNIWDFGGQEIMHAIHQFFMTTRTVYLLVLDAEQGEEGSRLDYWLKLIESFGQDSPIIVVSNKRDLAQLTLDQRTLKQKYPTIRAFVETSCKTGEGIDELAKLISAIIGSLTHVRDEIPEVWLELKAELEELKKDYITYNDYVRRCQAKYITREREQRVLIRLLHDLGVVLSFQDDPRLRDTSVLNPTWVTGAVYKIINAEMLQQSQGVLEIGQLDEILERDRYPREKHLFIIELMRKFELCFEFEGHTEEKFLIPDLLSEEKPALKSFANSLDFEYRYDFWPSSVISRFMVRMNLFIFHHTRWRNGMMLVNNKNRALVKAAPERNRIRISIVGPLQNRWRFWKMVYEQFDSIHKTIKGLNAQANLLVAGDVKPIEAVPKPIKPEWVTQLKNDLEEIRLRGHPQTYYPLAFLLGQRCYEELRDYTQARQAFVKAHEAISAWRSLMREEPDKRQKQLSKESVNLYEMLVHCYLVEGDKGKAFKYAAVAKGRAFVNTLTRSRFDFENVPGEKADFLPKLEQIRQKRREIEYLDTHSSLDMGERREKLDVLLREEAEGWREMEREFPLLTATLSVPTLSLTQARQLAQELDATLVEYYRHAGGWCAFVITFDGVKYVGLDGFDDKLIKRLLKWTKRIEYPTRIGRTDKRLHCLDELHQAAIVPLQKYLPKEKVVILAPFGQLHLLPLAAARHSTGRYLAEAYTLAFVPSLTALYVAHQQVQKSKEQFEPTPEQKPLLSVAYPGEGDNYLQNVSKEAQYIAQLFQPSELIQNQDATPQEVIRKARDRRILHLSCHGEFDSEKPDQSGLMLADDCLTVQEIITKLHLKQAQLVTLAACRSGQVAVRKGEEQVGLLQAMMTAGAQSVVASLWRVDDEATRELFVSFYQNIASGHSPATSIRQAAQKVRQKARTKHPYYWAAFQVNGLGYQSITPGLIKAARQNTTTIASGLQRSKGDQSMDLESIVDSAEMLLEDMTEQHADLMSKLSAEEQAQVAKAFAELCEEAMALQTESQLWDVAHKIHCLVEPYPALREKLMPGELPEGTDVRAVQQQRYGSKNIPHVSKNTAILRRVIENKPQAENHLNNVREELAKTSYDPNEASDANRVRNIIQKCLTILQTILNQPN